MFCQQRTVTANANFPLTIFLNFFYNHRKYLHNIFNFIILHTLQTRHRSTSIFYRTYKTALKVQVKWNYYVNYDIKVLQSTCGIRRATSRVHGMSTRALVFRADSVDIVFSIFPRGTKDTCSQPTDKLHVVTTDIQTHSFLPLHRTQRNVQILWSSDCVQRSDGDMTVAAGGVGTQGVACRSCVVTTDSR